MSHHNHHSHHHHEHPSFENPGISKDEADATLASFGEQLRNTNVTNIFAALQNLSATFIENGGPQTVDQPESPSEHMGHDMSHNMGHDMGHDMSQGRDMAHDHTMHEMPADSSLHAGHGGHGTDHGMATYFYFGFENVQMLFQKWIINDLSSLLFACFILMVICIFSEWLKIWRENTTTKMIFKAQKRISSSSSRTDGLLTDSGLESGLGSSSRGSNDYLLQPVATGLVDGLTSRLHIVLSITYTVQQFISLFVMLVFMTFNLYLCFTIVLSHGLGFYIFGWRRMILSNGGNLMNDAGACH